MSGERQGNLFDKRLWKPTHYRGRYTLDPAKQLEERLHEAIVALMYRSGLPCPEECMFYHPFNEIPLADETSQRRALRRGLQPGLLDLYFERPGDPTNRRSAPVRMWMEFKRNENLELSPAQQRVAKFYERCFVKTHVVTSYRQGFLLLREHGFLRPGCV